MKKALSILSTLAMSIGFSAQADIETTQFKLDPTKNPECAALLRATYGKIKLDRQGRATVQFAVNESKTEIAVGVLTKLYNTFEARLSLPLKTQLASRYMGIDFISSLVTLKDNGNDGFEVDISLVKGPDKDPNSPSSKVIGLGTLVVAHNSAILDVTGELAAGLAERISCQLTR